MPAGPKKFLLLLSLILLTLISLSCGPEEPKPEKGLSRQVNLPVDAIVNTPEAMPIITVDPSSREGEGEDTDLTPMTYGSGPRLTGILWSDQPLAIIELVDQGFIVGVGDKVCGYKLSAVNKNSVTLLNAGRRIELRIKEENKCLNEL